MYDLLIPVLLQDRRTRFETDACRWSTARGDERRIRHGGTEAPRARRWHRS